jgi:hypothetical protein
VVSDVLVDPCDVCDYWDTGAVSLFDVYGALYANRDGTSQAAPFVTGMIALLMSAEVRDAQPLRSQ